MKISVDPSRCVGSGQCIGLSSELFDQNEDDGTVLLLLSSPPPGLFEDAREAARICPARAITIEEDE